LVLPEVPVSGFTALRHPGTHDGRERTSARVSVEWSRRLEPVCGELQMTTAIAVLCGLVAINFAFLYWLSLRENLGVGEYAQFLLMNPEAYADQRRKFLEFLGTTTGKTSTQRAIDAGKALARIARSMRSQLVLANATARNAIAGK
jgi:hypothetical protein